MDARQKLDELKILLNISTDGELAQELGTQVNNVYAWVKRNKIPERWLLVIKQKSKNIPISNNKIQISYNNLIQDDKHETKEICELIKNYATPKLIQEFKEKLIKIKKAHED